MRDLTAQNRILVVSGKSQIGVESGSHALVVEHANSLGSHRQIELQLRPVHNPSTCGDGTLRQPCPEIA